MESRIEDLYVGEDFYARGEYAGGFLFFHCELYKHDKNTIKKIRKAIEEVLINIKQFGYNKPVYSCVEKGPIGKLSRLAGGTLLTTYIFEDKEYEVYQWEQK